MMYQIFIPGFSREIAEFVDTFRGGGNFAYESLSWLRSGDVIAELKLYDPVGNSPSTLGMLFGERETKEVIQQFEFRSPVTGRVGYKGNLFTNVWWQQGSRSAPQIADSMQIVSQGFNFSVATDDNRKIKPSEIYGDFFRHVISERKYFDEVSKKSKYYFPDWYEFFSKEYDFFDQIHCPAFTQKQMREMSEKPENQEYYDKLFR